MVGKFLQKKVILEMQRDLLWTFGNEEKINKKDIFFHNANSIARTSILQNFHLKMT